mgnify:CR=1 FL=1
MEVVLIRHFKTVGNLEGRYIGSTDEPVVQKEAAEEVRKKYPEVETLVSSPMKRCLQTAELIYGRQPDIVCELLREKDFGKFEGKNHEELKEEPKYQEWLDSGGALPFPEGEAQEHFQSRSVKGFNLMTDSLIEEECEKAAFVVHGGTIMAILSEYVAGSLFYDWQVPNGDGYIVRIDEAAWKAGRKKIVEFERLW